MARSRFVAVLLLCVAGFAFAAAAQAVTPIPVSLPAPAADKPVLSMSTASGMRQFSLRDLEAAGMKEVTTKTFWPADDGTYQGPLLADVLKLAGIHNAAAVRIIALDGFSQVLPREDWTRWPLLLATRRDGKPMTTRDKGPLRVIYPRDLDPGLAASLYRLRWVWLVKSIEPVAAP